MNGLQPKDDRAAPIARPTVAALVVAPSAGAGLTGVLLPRSVASTIPIVIVALAIAGSALRPRRSSGPTTLGTVHLVTLAGVGALLAALGPRLVGWPYFFPVAKSVDAAHHGALVDWIARNGRLPSKIEPELRQFSEYFVLPHRLVGVVSDVFGVSPMQALGVAGLLALGVVLTSVASLAGRYCGAVLGRTEGHAAAFLVFPCALMLSHFTIGALAESYFFGQMVALAFGVAACVGIVANARPLLIVVIGAASVAAYPLQGPLVPGVLVVLVLLTRDRRHLRTLLGVLGLGGLAFAAQYPYLGAARAMSTDEGSIITLSLETGGGALFAVLVLAGLFAVIRNLEWTGARTTDVGGVVIVSGFLLTTLQYLAFRVAATQEIVSNYSAGKIVFMIAPFAICLAAIGAVFAMSTLLHRSALVLCGAVISGVVMVGAGTSVEVATRGPMDHDAYVLAQWMRNRDELISAGGVGVVGDQLTPYFVRWSALGQPIEPIQYLDLDQRLPWRAWPRDSATSYVIVAGRSRVAAYLARPGVREVARRGDAVLLKRDGS